MSNFNFNNVTPKGSIGAITDQPDRISNSFPKFSAGCVIDPRTKCVIGTATSGPLAYVPFNHFGILHGPILD